MGHLRSCAKRSLLAHSRIMQVSVLSPAWKKSKWTLKEYSFAEEIGVPVFLLKAKIMGPALAIAGIPFIDFVEDEHKGFQKLDRELTRKGL